MDKGVGIPFWWRKALEVAYGQHRFYNAHHPLYPVGAGWVLSKALVCANLESPILKLMHLSEEFSL